MLSLLFLLEYREICFLGVANFLKHINRVYISTEYGNIFAIIVLFVLDMHS